MNLLKVMSDNKIMRESLAKYFENAILKNYLSNISVLNNV